MADRRSRSPLAIARALDAHCAQLGACRRCINAPGVLPIVSAARRPRAMLVGQAPGRTEMAGGRPFAGPAGRKLFRWFASIGLDEATAREWLYIAAVTRCYPGPHKAGRGDRVPSPSERARCSDWLDQEISIIRPSVIIPVGRLAIDRFLGPVPLDAVVGRAHEVEHAAGSSLVIPPPHPSGASSWLYQAENKALLDRALELLRRELMGKPARRRSVA